MGFLKRLFSGEKSDKPYVDKRGIYFYVQCDNCGSRVRVRADKEYDLNREGGGFVWHKTIIDSRCFRPMHATVRLDSAYNMTAQEVENGRFLTQAEYDALEKPTAAD
ncbi:MAG: hypothetical protein GY803_01445 [Chloroflexi bacterium]|nr:hypothetical protein [Chloroflexota bacterium]